MCNPPRLTTSLCSDSTIRFARAKCSCHCDSVAASGSISCSFKNSRAMKSGLPPSRMSVPRPAMFVAIVTAPLRPACATISASCAWYFALSTTCLSMSPPVAERLVGRDHHLIEVVDLRELFRFGIGGAGHAGELLVLAEVVLKRDGGERL